MDPYSSETVRVIQNLHSDVLTFHKESTEKNSIKIGQKIKNSNYLGSPISGHIYFENRKCYIKSFDILQIGTQ